VTRNALQQEAVLVQLAVALLKAELVVPVSSTFVESGAGAPPEAENESIHDDSSRHREEVGNKQLCLVIHRVKNGEL